MSRRPNFGGMGAMGGMNMQQMMKQAKKMQAEMAEQQATITAQSFTGESADGLVKATFTGDRKLTDIKIAPAAIGSSNKLSRALAAGAVNFSADSMKKKRQVLSAGLLASSAFNGRT